MSSTNNKPLTVKIVGWFSLLLGVLLSLSGGGNMVAQSLNYGGVYEYDAILQTLAGIIMLVSSVYFMKGNRKARQALEASLWFGLLVSVSTVTTIEPNNRATFAIAMLQIWIPMALLIYGVRNRVTRSYVNGT